MGDDTSGEGSRVDARGLDAVVANVAADANSNVDVNVADAVGKGLAPGRVAIERSHSSDPQSLSTSTSTSDSRSESTWRSLP